MSADLATLAIRIDAATASTQVLQWGTIAERSAESTGILEQAVGRLEGAMSHIRVLFGLGLFGFKFLHETIEAQDAMAQLEAGVRSTGMAAGFTAHQLSEQAESLEALSTFSDEAIERGQGVLLLFERLSGVNFERATLAATDLAARLGEDIPSAARLLGKAMEDPEVGMMALRRAGVILSQGQKEVIKTLKDTGHEAEAQAKILDILEQKIGGSAAAARDTLGGALKGVAHDFGNLFEVSRQGSSILVSTIQDASAGLRFMKEHGDALNTTMLTLASTWIARNVASMVAYGRTQAQIIVGTTMATEAQVRYTGALVATAVAEQRTAAFEAELAAATLANAAANEQCAFTETERVTATTALAAAQARLAEAETVNTAATIRLTEAQIAETIAVVAAGRAATITGVLMVAAGNAAKIAWTAIGGPVGAVVIGLFAVYEIVTRIMAKQKEASTALANDPALERVIAVQNAAIAAEQRRIDDASAAATAAKKANAERDAETSKMLQLNDAYEKSALALKIMDIELSASIEKIKAHKNVAQDQWAALDKSIDAMTRAQVAAAKLAATKQATSDLNDLKASNAAMIQGAEDAGRMADAQAAVAIAQQISTRAGIDAQIALDHLNIELETNAKLATAKVALEKASVGALDEEIRAAQAYYDETVRGINAERAVRDATIDRIRAIDDLKSAMHSFGDLMSLITGESAFSLSKLIDIVKQLGDTIAALAKNGSLQNAIGVILGREATPVAPGAAPAAPSAAMAQAAKYAQIAAQGAAMLGASFGVGNAVGGLTTNRAVGALAGGAAGALTGAGMGATMGGPIGAVVGAIIGAGAGLIGGFLGAKSAAEKVAAAMKQVEMAHAQIAASLSSWRAQITGTAQDQRKANEADLRWKYLQLVQTIQQVEAGKRMEDQRNKDLQEASTLYALAQKKLTDTTNELNEAFSGMIGAVSGYKLNLALFKYSPALGPGETPGSASNGAGSNAGMGGSSRGGSRQSFEDTPLIVQMAVDGKVLAQSTVKHLRRVAQANFGSTDHVVEALTLL